MEERFSPGDRDHRGTAFLDRLKTLFGGEVLPQNVLGILNFSAPGTGEIATKQRFEHQDEGIAFATAQTLGKNVCCDCPHLGKGNRHPRLLRLDLERSINSSND
jgi:hypothetical protein